MDKIKSFYYTLNLPCHFLLEKENILKIYKDIKENKEIVLNLKPEIKHNYIYSNDFSSKNLFLSFLKDIVKHEYKLYLKTYNKLREETTYYSDKFLMSFTFEVNDVNITQILLFNWGATSQEVLIKEYKNNKIEISKIKENRFFWVDYMNFYITDKNNNFLDDEEKSIILYLINNVKIIDADTYMRDILSEVWWYKDVLKNINKELCYHDAFVYYCDISEAKLPKNIKNTFLLRLIIEILFKDKTEKISNFNNTIFIIDNLLENLLPNQIFDFLLKLDNFHRDINIVNFTNSPIPTSRFDKEFMNLWFANNNIHDIASLKLTNTTMLKDFNKFWQKFLNIFDYSNNLDLDNWQDLFAILTLWNFHIESKDEILF